MCGLLSQQSQWATITPDSPVVPDEGINAVQAVEQAQGGVYLKVCRSYVRERKGRPASFDFEVSGD